MEHHGPNWQQFLTVVGLLVAAISAAIGYALMRIGEVSSKAHERMSAIEAEDRRTSEVNAREIAELRTYVARHHPTNEHLAQTEQRIRADIGELKGLLRIQVRGDRP